MNVHLTVLHDLIKKFQPPNVKFVQGDSYKIQEIFTPEFLYTLPYPWVIIEDVCVNSPDILKYFDTYMQVRDYFVVDDTNPHMFLKATVIEFLHGFSDLPACSFRLQLIIL